MQYQWLLPSLRVYGGRSARPTAYRLHSVSNPTLIGGAPRQQPSLALYQLTLRRWHWRARRHVLRWWLPGRTGNRRALLRILLVPVLAQQITRTRHSILIGRLIPIVLRLIAIVRWLVAVVLRLIPII